jgi:hypothetical protein
LKDRGHGHTIDELRDLVKSVRSGEFEYDERPPRRSLDWSSYTETQAYELADMLRLIPKMVEEAVNRIPAEELERKGPGRPQTHSPGDVARVMLMQSYFGVSNRVAPARRSLQGEAAPLRHLLLQNHREGVRHGSRD